MSGDSSLTIRVTENLFEKVGEIAYSLSKRRTTVDMMADWVQAERIVITHYAELRYKLTKFNGNGVTEEEVFKSVESECKWRTWADSNLKIYFSIEAAEASFADNLRQAFETTNTGVANVLMATVLDGAPEFARGNYQKHVDNCVDPKYIVEEKDAKFYSIAADAIRLYGGSSWDELLQQKWQNGGTRAFGRELASGRYFQDACIGVFPDATKQSTCNALATGLYLCKQFRKVNVALHASWQNEFGARISIARTPGALVDGLLLARRDEISIDSALFNELSDCHKTTLLASGVHVYGSQE